MNQMNTASNRRATTAKVEGAAAQGKEDEVCISIICSMAPRLVLKELTEIFTAATGWQVELTAMGGVDAAQKVRDSDKFHVAVLSKDSIQQLRASKHLHHETVDLLESEVAVAVPSGCAHPDLSCEDAVKKSVLSAQSISYSTGPSGRALAALFDRWGVSKTVAERLICPPPGTPVASLLASREAELGFQQRSELMHAEGIDVVGPLPRDIQIVTTFTAGVCQKSSQSTEVQQLLLFLQSPLADDTKYRQGMRPA